MGEQRLVIIGGGLAGLSAGVYARRNGYRTTIVEHNLALGGVCTAWHRGPYTVDGCIHWLTGGPFQRLYEELGILPAVPLQTLDTWLVYRDARDGFELPITRNLDAFAGRLAEIAPPDAPEIARLRAGARTFVDMRPPIDAPETLSVRDALRAMWDMRGQIPTLVHFRKPMGIWVNEHLTSPRLRRLFTRLIPEEAPAVFLLMVLGYLERGYLSRPTGGTAAFRDALENTYRGLGGEALVHTTVDEVLVSGGRASGVRLADGRMLPADIVLSTASAPETVLRFLGGRYDAEPTRERLAKWKLFDPIVLASFGVSRPYADSPPMLIIEGVKPFTIGGRENGHLYVRVYNDGPGFAPPGHTVVQALLTTDYDWWATRGTRYSAAKDATAETALTALEPHFPGLSVAVQMTDIATPLTYWNMARSWRGAFEGWMPSADALLGHVKKKLAGLEGFYMAGQWVEPGGGVPMAVMSGRQAVQLMCEDNNRVFVPTGAAYGG